jgi:hypothetical protein
MKNEWLDRAAKREIESLQAGTDKEIQSLRAGLQKEIESLNFDSMEDAIKQITALRAQIESQREEFERTLEEGYEEAYKMILELRDRNNNLETTLYEEYDGKLKEMKEFIVDKVDQFLRLKSEELRDANHDTAAFILQTWLKQTTPRQIVEDAIGEQTGELTREELKAQMRILEAKNMRLSAECDKLRREGVDATRREKETRKAAGLPDEPVMQGMMTGLLGTALKKKRVGNVDESYTDS